MYLSAVEIFLKFSSQDGFIYMWDMATKRPQISFKASDSAACSVLGVGSLGSNKLLRYVS